jgi:hypothetical protein
MPVVSERGSEWLLIHDDETGALGEAPAFVGAFLIEREGAIKQLAGLRTDCNVA